MLPPKAVYDGDLDYALSKDLSLPVQSQLSSTLHTNSAIGAIPRLLDLGVLPDIMAGNIIGVVAQRLIRKLCANCKVPDDLDDVARKLLGVDSTFNKTVYRHVGCAQCDNQGYKGRMAIMELFKFDSVIDDLMTQRASSRELREAARKTGYRTLAEDAISRVIDGHTSLDEITRVVDLTDRIL